MKYKNVTRKEFNKALGVAQASRGPYGLCVSPAGKGMSYYLAEDDQSGFAMRNNYLGAVFSHIETKGRLAGIVWAAKAIAYALGYDVVTLECFEGLAPVYSRYGFIMTERHAFDPQYAPKGWSLGRQDYYKMTCPAYEPSMMAA